MVEARPWWTQHIRVQWEAKGHRGRPLIEKTCWRCQDKIKGMQRSGWALSKLLDTAPPAPLSTSYPFNIQPPLSQFLPGVRGWAA